MRALLISALVLLTAGCGAAPAAPGPPSIWGDGANTTSAHVVVPLKNRF